MARVRTEVTYRGRRAAHARTLAERARRRERGELLDTRDALVARFVREHLRAHGWNHDWPPPPEGVASVPGRPRGPNLHRGPDRLTVRLPAPLAWRVRAAAHWFSQESVEVGQAAPVSAAGIVRAAALAAVGD